MGSRTIIGQAQSVHMKRMGIDAGQALEYSKRASSTSKHKLVQIAAEIAETRTPRVRPKNGRPVSGAATGGLIQIGFILGT